MRRLIWLPLAGALLIGGATVTAASPDLVSEVTGGVAAVPARAGDLVADVLADLVEQDVISQAQVDAITDALDARLEQDRAEMEARFEAMRAVAEQVRTFMDDGAITADEVAQLPDGELKNALEGLLQDGDITPDRLREMGGFGFVRRGPGHGGPERDFGHVWPAPFPAPGSGDGEVVDDGK
jgi:hypothetical protein